MMAGATAFHYSNCASCCLDWRRRHGDPMSQHTLHNTLHAHEHLRTGTNPPYRCDPTEAACPTTGAVG